MHFETLTMCFTRKAIPRFIITITVRIMVFSTISFTPFLLSHLPLPGVFSLTAPHLRVEDAAFALVLPGLGRPCPALRAEQREQTAYLTQITLSKLPGPVLVLLKRQHKVCSCVQPWPREAPGPGSAAPPAWGAVLSLKSFSLGEKLLKAEASLAHCFRVLLGISFLEGFVFHFLF